MEREREWGFSTRCVWGGEPDAMPEGATVMPVYHGVTFAYDDVAEWRAAATGARPGHIYSRNSNPTVGLFEERMRAIEGAERATAFATGMAAISNTLFALLSPGDRAVTIRDTYGGTNRLFTEFLPRFGIETVVCPTRDHDGIEAEVARGCRLLHLESPTNPTLEVLDLATLARKGREAGAVVVVDNTFATPINQRPLELGADLVVHSATKFLGGHSDAMGGVLLGAAELVERVFRFREINGASLDPHSAFLLTRGLATLELRVRRQNRNAQAVAEFLEGHPLVGDVFYPGLPSHPKHDLARRQMDGFGGVLSFSLAGDGAEPSDAGASDPEAADRGASAPAEAPVGDRAGGSEARVARFVEALRLAHRAASLGSVSTLVGPPSTTSHVELTAEARAAAGIPESLIRYSVGVENAEDLVADLERALQVLEEGEPEEEGNRGRSGTPPPAGPAVGSGS